MEYSEHQFQIATDLFSMAQGAGILILVVCFLPLICDVIEWVGEKVGIIE